jgi:hypothetical protein
MSALEKARDRAGLRRDALTPPFVVDAPIDRRIFETYAQTQPAPTLRPGDVSIMDNLPDSLYGNALFSNP